MVNTSYRILSTGAFFFAGVFLGISPALKAAWQEDAIKVLEQRLDEEGIVPLVPLCVFLLSVVFHFA
jgi:hypothetical protein